MNSAGDGICGFDVNGKTTFVNPAAARMTGWEIKDLVGRTERELFEPTALTKDGASAETDSKDRSFRRRDGSIFLGEYTKTTI